LLVVSISSQKPPSIRQYMANGSAYKHTDVIYVLLQLNVSFRRLTLLVNGKCWILYGSWIWS